MIAPTKLAAADLFCGAGGSTTGAEMSGRVDVVLAINHWRTAVYTHQNNHPHTRHICAPIDSVDPRHDASIPDIDLLMASPECQHHSNARGGKPISDQKRATPWNVLHWIETKKPKWAVVENVPEFLSWGNIDAHGKRIKSEAGKIFTAWVNAIRALGYQVEWRILNAADYGAHTSRRRLFVIARRGPEDIKIPWPRKQFIEGQWRPVHEVLDWTLPCPSVFSRKKPLAEKTLRRIEIGLRKFVGEAAEPFIVHLRGQSTANHTSEPLRTITACNHFALVSPFVVSYHGGNKPGRDGTERCQSVENPLGTIDTNPRFALATPFLIDVNHGASSCHEDRSRSVERPINTITGSKGQALVLPFLVKYNRTGLVEPVDRPLTTVTTKPRHGLALVTLMQELWIQDIGFRMLAIHELAQAQGFPAHYHFTGTKAEQIKQIGNSVAPAVMSAICSAIGSAA